MILTKLGKFHYIPDNFANTIGYLEFKFLFYDFRYSVSYQYQPWWSQKRKTKAGGRPVQTFVDTLLKDTGLCSAQF